MRWPGYAIGRFAGLHIVVCGFNCGRYAHGHRNPYSGRYSHGNGYGYAHGHRSAYQHCYGYSHGHGDCYPDPWRYANPNTGSDANRDIDTNAAIDPGGELPTVPNA